MDFTCPIDPQFYITSVVNCFLYMSFQALVEEVTSLGKLVSLPSPQLCVRILLNISSSPFPHQQSSIPTSTFILLSQLSKRTNNIRQNLLSTHNMISSKRTLLSVYETGKGRVPAACHYQNQTVETRMNLYGLFFRRWQSEKTVGYVPSKTILTSHLKLIFL